MRQGHQHKFSCGLFAEFNVTFWTSVYSPPATGLGLLYSRDFIHSDLAD